MRLGGNAWFLRLDVAREADWTAAFAAVAERAGRIGEVPLGRLATPDDVAAAFVYLASDEASFVNGAAFPVDGGVTAG